MNINLHIDSIVLDGIELAAGDDRLLQQVLSRELSTLLVRDGFADPQSQLREVASIQGGTIRLGAAGNQPLAQQLAGSIHQGLGVACNQSTTAMGGSR